MTHEELKKVYDLAVEIKKLGNGMILYLSTS
jgi:hypothetical protein